MKKLIGMVLILAILGIILSSYLLFNPKIRAYRKLDEILIANEMKSGLAIPKELFELGAVYKGKLTTQNICKTYDNIVTKVIPKYYKKCKNMNDDELNKYYQKNKDIIYIELGIEEFNEFNGLINRIINLQGTKLEYENCSLIADSIKEEDTGITVYISIKYKNNTDLILNSFVQNKVNKNASSIILKAAAL